MQPVVKKKHITLLHKHTHTHAYTAYIILSPSLFLQAIIYESRVDPASKAARMKERDLTLALLLDS